MEKKNTMLLTVIAVATLLVAVVGATFAFFSLSVGGETTNTMATVKTGKTGMFTFTKEKENLTLNVTADLMAEGLVSDAEKPIDYFVDPTKDDGTPKTLKEGLTGDSAPSSDYYVTFGKLTLSGADSGTKYHCEGKYTIKATFEDADGVLPGTATTDKESVADEDGRLYLNTTTTSGDAVTISIKDDSEGHPDESGVNAISHTLKSLISKNKVFWVTFDFTSSGTDIEADLQAALKVSNRNVSQNYLAAKKITVIIEPDNGAGKLTCTIAGSGE